MQIAARTFAVLLAAAVSDGMATGGIARELSTFTYPEYNLKVGFPARPEQDRVEQSVTFLANRGGLKETFLLAVGPRRDVRGSHTADYESSRDFFVSEYRGRLIDDTPIVWHGHEGRDFTFVYTSRGGRFVSRNRLLNVGNRRYTLTHSTMLFVNDRDAAHSEGREQACRFFDSLQLLQPVEPDRRDEPQSLRGHWQLVSRSGSAVSDKDSSVYAFLDDGFYVCLAAEWKTNGLGYRRQGEFRVSGQGDVRELDLIYSFASDAPVPGIFTVREGVLTMRHAPLNSTRRPVGFELTEVDDARILVFRRPGDDRQQSP